MNNKQTPLELARECREQADKATPGPWAQLDGFPKYIVLAAERGRPIGWLEMPLLDDMAFIASARTDVPALCDAVEAQAAEIGRLRAALESAEELLSLGPMSTVMNKDLNELAHMEQVIVAFVDRARAALEVKP